MLSQIKTGAEVATDLHPVMMIEGMWLVANIIFVRPHAPYGTCPLLLSFAKHLTSALMVLHAGPGSKFGMMLIARKPWASVWENKSHHTRCPS